MYRLVLVCLALVIGLLPVNGQTYQKRLALVIGNSAYQNGGALKNPVNDARAISSALQNAGFEVLRHENLTQNQMKKAINDFGLKLRDFEVGLFYYAGHGIQHKGINYMIPVEADLQAAEQVEFDCVPADRVLAFMDAASTKVNILIMDACRNNPFERSWNRSFEGSGLAMMNAPTGTLIAYATAPGKVASDGESANGLYTSVLLKYLKDPALNIEQVFKRVRTEVTEKSHGAQVPWETTSLTGGDFYFTSKALSAENYKPTDVIKTDNTTRELNAENPEQALQFYTSGMEKYDQQNYKEAIANFTKAINNNPRDFQAYLWRGHSKYNLGYLNGIKDNKMLEEAIADYSMVIQLDPANSDAYFYRANAKKLLDRYTETIPDFTMAIKYDPKKWDNYYYRGLTYYLLKKYWAAIEDFTKSIELDNTNPESYYWRGANYYGAQEYAKSIEDFNQAIALNPDYLDAYFFKGDAYYDLKDYDNARQAYEYYVARKPEPDVLIFVAHCLYNTQQYDKALVKYNEVLKINPSYAEAYYWRSHLYFFGLKDKANAVKEINKALAIDPNNATYLEMQKELK
ncbi:MAG: tetratricopeptide repeat protein [Cyclobacteriaceae bacterium]|nr:tetratricopeptide repeat protein [Cyclobacteriaceae bacterium]